MYKWLVLIQFWFCRLKAVVSIPKVQPRFAIAIWKKYPTLKSLLRVYMDPTKTVSLSSMFLYIHTSDDGAIDF